MQALAHLQKQHDELEKLQDSTQDAADSLANALAEEHERAAGAQRKLQDELADAVEAKEASATLLGALLHSLLLRLCAGFILQLPQCAPEILPSDSGVLHSVGVLASSCSCCNVHPSSC